MYVWLLCGPHKMPSRAACGSQAVVCPPLVCQDRLETDLLKLFANQENSEQFTITSVIIFDQHCCWTETSIVGNDFFFIFHKFPLRSTLLFPILPYSVSGFFGFIHVFILYLNTGLVMWRKNTNPTSPDYKWKVWHCLKKVDADRTPHFHRRQRHPPTLNDPPKNSVVQLNRLRTGVGRFHSCLYKWGMASPAACECGSEEQTVDHVVLQWPIHRPLHGLHGLTVLDDETIEWLLNACPEI